MLSDLPAERAVLSGMFRYGAEAYYDVADLVSETAFLFMRKAYIREG